MYGEIITILFVAVVFYLFISGVKIEKPKPKTKQEEQDDFIRQTLKDLGM